MKDIRHRIGPLSVLLDRPLLTVLLGVSVLYIVLAVVTGQYLPTLIAWALTVIATATVFRLQPTGEGENL